MVFYSFINSCVPEMKYYLFKCNKFTTNYKLKQEYFILILIQNNLVLKENGKIWKIYFWHNGIPNLGGSVGDKYQQYISLEKNPLKTEEFLQSGSSGWQKFKILVIHAKMNLI